MMLVIGDPKRSWEREREKEEYIKNIAIIKHIQLLNQWLTLPGVINVLLNYKLSKQMVWWKSNLPC